jgi:hypothetical protein
MRRLGFPIMRGTIQFNRQTRSRAIKVKDEAVRRLLPPELGADLPAPQSLPQGGLSRLCFNAQSPPLVPS